MPDGILSQCIAAMERERGIDMLEKYLIEHCSPTLASLKTASLFTYCYHSEEELKHDIRRWNVILQKKGIELIVLKKQDGKALVYVCRLSYLLRDLHRPGVDIFLQKYGYDKIELSCSIARLKKRLLCCETFPHEIGIFLGYPLGDVIGFIENAGMNSKCSGCWKVYCNECEAVKTFAKYKKCREVYLRLWRQGRSVWQLTVCPGQRWRGADNMLRACYQS